MHGRMDGLGDSRIASSAAQTCTREPTLLPLVAHFLSLSVSLPPSLQLNAGQGLLIQDVSRYANTHHSR